MRRAAELTRGCGQRQDPMEVCPRPWGNRPHMPVVTPPVTDLEVPALTPATVALALLSVVGLAVGTPYLEIILHGTQIGSFAPPPGALLILLLLTGLVDPCLRLLRRRRGSGLTQSQLLGVYVALLAAAALPSCQFAGWLATITTGPFYYATSANHWEDAWRHLPSWWGPRAPVEAEAIRQLYEGLDPGVRIPWGTWLKPLLAFGPMVIALYVAFLAVGVLLAPQWIDREKLAFPLVQLPLDLTQGGDGSPHLWRSFLRSRLMWVGATIPIVCHTLNGLHRFLPTVPEVPLRGIDLNRFLVGRPWVAAQPLRIDIHLCLVGFAALCSRDVPTSTWVFFLIAKLESVFGCAMGWTAGPPSVWLRDIEFPVLVAQQVGSTLMFLGLMLWAARGYLREAWRRAGAPTPEGRQHRLSFVTLGVTFVGLCAWSMAGGMQAWVAAGLWLLTLAFMVVAHRMMAEGGVNLLWDAQSGPNYLLYALDGGRYLGPRTWMQLVCLPYFTWHFKGAVGPHAFESLKLISAAGLDRRRALGVMVAAMVLAAVVSYLTTVWLVLRHGGGVVLEPFRFEHVGLRPMWEFSAVTDQPQGFQWPKLAGMAASAVVTWGLSWLRWRYEWWRLHPIGYILGNTIVVWFMWASVALGSALSWLVVRYGGARGYRAARPFFLGLIFGDFLMLGLWTVITAATGTRDFQLFVI